MAESVAVLPVFAFRLVFWPICCSTDAIVICLEAALIQNNQIITISSIFGTPACENSGEVLVISGLLECLDCGETPVRFGVVSDLEFHRSPAFSLLKDRTIKSWHIESEASLCRGRRCCSSIRNTCTACLWNNDDFSDALGLQSSGMPSLAWLRKFRMLEGKCSFPAVPLRRMGVCTFWDDLLCCYDFFERINGSLLELEASSFWADLLLFELGCWEEQPSDVACVLRVIFGWDASMDNEGCPTNLSTEARGTSESFGPSSLLSPLRGCATGCCAWRCFDLSANLSVVKRPRRRSQWALLHCLNLPSFFDKVFAALTRYLSAS